MNRRQFLERSTSGALGTALAVATGGGAMFMLEGCSFNIASIGTWVSVGNGTIGSILNLLVGAGLLACATCSAVANAAMAAITAIGTAVTNYENSPAAGKATFLGKLQTALQAGLGAATTFFTSLSLHGSNLLALIAGLAGLVLNAIAGFIGQVGAPPAPASLTMLERTVSITPTLMSAGQFKSAVNKLLVQFGHPEEVLR